MLMEADLPEDVEVLRALVLEQARELDKLKAFFDEVERLRAIIEAMQRYRFGRRSEQLDPEDISDGSTPGEADCGTGAVEQFDPEGRCNREQGVQEFAAFHIEADPVDGIRLQQQLVSGGIEGGGRRPAQVDGQADSQASEDRAGRVAEVELEGVAGEGDLGAGLEQPDFGNEI